MQEVFIEVSKAVFAICDSESMYIYNLMEYVHGRKGEEFEVQAFTGVCERENNRDSADFGEIIV